jgi:hypothetical protein
MMRFVALALLLVRMRFLHDLWCGIWFSFSRRGLLVRIYGNTRI